MGRIIFIMAVIFMTGCLSGRRDAVRQKKPNAGGPIQSPSGQAAGVNPSPDSINGIATIRTDTTMLSWKRWQLKNQFIQEHGSALPIYDSLLDLNYDGHADYVIGYYGSSGTGIKNRIQVFLYNNRCGCYIPDETLSNLSNPTFFLGQKKMTGFYIGLGAGSGKRLEWIGGRWKTTKEFSVSNDQRHTSGTVWKIRYPMKHRTAELHRPFQMVPPDDILETRIKIP